MPSSTVEGGPQVTRRMALFLGRFGTILGAESVRLGRTGGACGIGALGTGFKLTIVDGEPS